MLTKFMQTIIDGLVALLKTVIGLLPSSPFASVYNLTIDNELLQFLAWIVPYPQIIAVLQAWLATITVFYLYQIVMRWVKVIS